MMGLAERSRKIGAGGKERISRIDSRQPREHLQVASLADAGGSEDDDRVVFERLMADRLRGAAGEQILFAGDPATVRQDADCGQTAARRVQKKVVRKSEERCANHEPSVTK